MSFARSRYTIRARDRPRNAPCPPALLHRESRCRMTTELLTSRRDEGVARDGSAARAPCSDRAPRTRLTARFAPCPPGRYAIAP
jgi:hypothetical protein